MSICFFLFFSRFDGPPLFLKLFFRALFATCKDVGVAADHLLIDVSEDVPEGKGVISFIDLGHENHQKEHVPQFFAEILRIIVVDGGDNLGEFFLKIFFQAEGGLFLVPGAAGRAKKGLYCVQQEGKMMFVAGHGSDSLMKGVWGLQAVVCVLKGDLFLSSSSIRKSCFILLEQAEVIAVDLADELKGLLVGGMFSLFQFLDVFPGIPGRKDKMDLAVEFVIVLGDQVAGEQDIDCRIKEILFGEIAQSGAAHIVKIDGAFREFTAGLNAGAGDDLAQSDGVLAGNGPGFGIRFRQDQGANEIRAHLVTWLKKGEAGKVFDEATVTANSMEAFAGELDVLVFIDGAGKLTLSGYWYEKQRTGAEQNYGVF